MLTSFLLAAILATTKNGAPTTTGVHEISARSSPSAPVEGVRPTAASVNANGAAPTSSTSAAPEAQRKPVVPANARGTEASDPTITKVAVELSKWVKLDVEGLSRTTVSVIVFLFVLAVFATKGLDLFLRSKKDTDKKRGGEGKKAWAGTTGLAVLAGGVAFLFLSSQFSSVRAAAGTATTTRQLLGDISKAADQRDIRVRYLENQLEVLNRQLVSIPPLQASLATQQERLKQREQDLAEAKIQVDELRNELKTMHGLTAGQEKEILLLLDFRLLVWVFGVAIFTGFLINALRTPSLSLQEMLQRKT